MTKKVPVDNRAEVTKFVGYNHVAGQLGLSRRTIERMVRAGEFPQPLQLAPNRVGWKLPDIEKWLEERTRGLKRFAVTDPNDLADASTDELHVKVIDLLKELDLVGKVVLDRHGIKSILDVDELLSKGERRG